MCFPRRAHVLALALALHISPCDGVTFKLEPSHERCISETNEPRPPPSPTLGFPSDTVSQPMQRTVWIVAKDLPSDAEMCRRAATAEHWRSYEARLATGVIDIKRSRKWSYGARPGIPERDEVLRRPRTYEIPKVVSSKSYIAADSFSTPVLLQDLSTAAPTRSSTSTLLAAPEARAGKATRCCVPTFRRVASTQLSAVSSCPRSGPRPRNPARPPWDRAHLAVPGAAGDRTTRCSATSMICAARALAGARSRVARAHPRSAAAGAARWAALRVSAGWVAALR